MGSCMDQDRVEPDGGGWVWRHRRALAALVLSFWLAPTLLLVATALWFTARRSPGFALAAVLALVWVAVRVRRRRGRRT